MGATRLTGSDIAECAVERLRSRFPEVRFRRLDIGALGALGEFGLEFDAVSAMDTLFHLTTDEDYDRAFANVVFALKPGGYFIFSENLVHKEMPWHPIQVNRTLEAIMSVVKRHQLRMVARVPMSVLMNKPIDSSSWIPTKVWNALMAPVKTFPALGDLYGAILYPIDLVLTKNLREGPSIELVVCRKAAREPAVQETQA